MSLRLHRVAKPWKSRWELKYRIRQKSDSKVCVWWARDTCLLALCGEWATATLRSALLGWGGHLGEGRFNSTARATVILDSAQKTVLELKKAVLVLRDTVTPRTFIRLDSPLVDSFGTMGMGHCDKMVIWIVTNSLLHLCLKILMGHPVTIEPVAEAFKPLTETFTPIHSYRGILPCQSLTQFHSLPSIDHPVRSPRVRRGPKRGRRPAQEEVLPQSADAGASTVTR